MAHRGKRIAWISAALALVALVALCVVGRERILEEWYLLLQIDLSQPRLPSCRNHATFVELALSRHIQRAGWLPYEEGLSGEELVCRLDFGGAMTNCNHASGQRVGGWQMVNASLETWGKILAGMGDRDIPVLWCGRTDANGWAGSPVRIVIGVSTWDRRKLQRLHTVAGQGTAKSRSTDEFHFYIWYGMEELELAEHLARLNSILRECGEREVAIDVEGGLDYWDIAAPYQDQGL